MRFFLVMTSFFPLLLFGSSGVGLKTADSAEIHSSSHEEKEKFKPGDFIFDHIKDAHDWHILTIGEHHVSIPLPVILYSSTSGWHFFLSSKFHHGHEGYKGFFLCTSGEYKGKIIEKHSDGSISLPLDLSLTKNALSILISVVLISWIFISVARAYRKHPAEPPKGLQNALEVFILFIRDEVAKPSIGKHYQRFMPYLLTVFFFIWINNMMGLIPVFPGGANVTGNIAVTGILALFTFMLTTLNGNKHYWLEIFNAPGVPWWLKIPVPLMPVVEIAGMLIKPAVLMIRLFANIAAGHIIALGFFSLIFIFAQIAPALGYGVSVLSVTFVVFMSLLELLVALIQAYVFTLLSSIFFGMATAEPHEEKHE